MVNTILYDKVLLTYLWREKLSELELWSVVQSNSFQTFYSFNLGFFNFGGCWLWI